MTSKKKNTYTKSNIIGKIAKRAMIRRSLVEKMYDSMEVEIQRLLSTASDGNPVSLRLFEGITIDSEYVPSSVMRNNLTGEMIESMDKVKVKAKVTRNYSEKVSKNCKDVSWNSVNDQSFAISE